MLSGIQQVCLKLQSRAAHGRWGQEFCQLARINNSRQMRDQIKQSHCQKTALSFQGVVVRKTEQKRNIHGDKYQTPPQGPLFRRIVQLQNLQTWFQEIINWNLRLLKIMVQTEAMR